MSSEPFLHLKFTSQRPPPQYGHQLPFAHLVDPTVHELPDSLKTDVQREGIQRYLVQNFKEGSFVWEVVKERVSPNLDERREEEDPEVKDSDGMYIVVNRSWARTVGDSKLHLSLYVYQEDKHCATWHAYTDRTISYSRESESTPADAPAEPSDQEQADEQERDGDEEEEADPEPDEAAIPNEDPYSPPSALAQYVASMESRPSSPFEPPERDSERPHFDRPYKEPVADPADVEERVEKEDIKSPVEHGRNTRRKEKTKATSVEVKSRGRSDDEEKEKEEEKARGDRSRDSTRKGRKLAIESDPEEEERSKKDKVKARSGRETSEEEEEEDRRQSTPHIVKSQPIGHRSARKKDRDEEKEEDSRSRSRSPSPVKTRSSRSKKREPSPEPSSDSEARSRSSRSPSHEKDAPSPIPVAKPERGRKPGRAEKEKPPPASPSQSPSRSPSPRPKALSSRSKPATPPLAQDSRSPSPPRPKSRTSRRESVRPPSRSLSPVRDSRKTRTKGDTRVKSVEERSVEKVKERVRQLSGSRSRSRSRSRSPPRSRSPSPSPRSNRRATSRARGPEKDQERIEKVDRARGRSISRSPSPPEIPATRSSRRGKSSPPRRSSPSPPPAPRVAERSHGRRHSVAATTSRPKPAPRIPRAGSPTTEQPTWRSVSRNRHRRSDDSDEDTLVRGNMDDDALDIPAGGETTLLKAKPIKHRQSHSKRDEGFDPDEVARARRTAEREKGRGGEREEPQTLKTAVGGWFKSVGTFIATEAKLAVGTAEGEVHKAEAAVEHWEEAEREEKRKRKAERARRREERRQRREAEEVEKRKKEEELERMVDRAEDAAEDMLETSERLASRKEREAKRDTNKERRSRDTDHGGSGSEDEVSSRRPRHKHKEETTSVQSRSKHRASRPLSPEPEEEKRHSRSRDHRRHEKPSPTHESRSQRHRGEVSDQSDSDHREEEKEAKASARPALRQRAMSISASVDAGLRGLRESVSKIVSDARQVDTEQDEKDRDRERRRAERERRKIDKERKAIEEERRQLEQEAEQVGRSKRRRAERDRKEREDIRLAERAREPRREDVEDFEGKSSRPRRQRHGRSRPSSPSPLRVSPETVASESERPSSQSRRSDRREPPSSDDESTARKKPLVSSRNTPSSARRLDNDDSRAADPSPRRRHGQEPPRRSRADSVISDTDMSEAPSRSSRSVRSMDRSESEADTPAHIEAKRNARRNSTTIPIEQIRTLREQQLEAGTRSIPASPVTSKSRHDLPQRERASTRAEMPRSARDDSSDGDSLDVDTSRRPKPALAPPAAPAYPRRLSPAPVVASPVSSYGAYSPTDPPLRPRPVKPSSYRAPPPRTPSEQPRSETLAARFYTPASSGDSSDEADPSRPPSVRTRRGYSSGGSVASERRASHGERGDLRSPAASYRFPRSDSEPEEPPLRRIESFSRTHPSSYPFTTDDEGDYSEPALTTTRLRRGIEAEASSRSTKPHSKTDRFDSAAFEDSEPEAYGRTGSSSARSRHSYRRDDDDDDRSGVLHGATTKRSSQGREGGGGRRTMVSKPASTNPSSSSVSRTIPGMFNHRERPPIVETRHEDDDDDDEPTGYSTFSRSTTVDPYYSARSDPHDYGYGHRVVDPIIPPSFTPDLENGSSSPPPVRGFTGFDLRHHHSRQLEPSTSSNDGQGRRRGTDGKTGSGKKGLVGRSSVPFGANQAPVGRRMAQRLGVE